LNTLSEIFPTQYFCIFRGWVMRLGARCLTAVQFVAYGFLAIVMTISWSPPAAQAQSFSSEALERCRATVGRPIVQTCMFGKRGAMGNREAALEECRTQARPAVFKCMAGASGHAAPPRKEVVRTEPRHEAPRVAAKPASDGPKHSTGEASPAPQTATATPQVPAAAPAMLAAPGPATAPFGKRVALLIGNSAYEHVPTLPNAKNDATALAAAFQAAGFQSVTLKTDMKRDEVISALSEFARLADTADWAVVYYSGHGIEYRGVNYIIPTDARLLMDRDIDLEAVDIGKVMNIVDGAKRLRLIILDACRNNPFLDQMKRTIATRAVTRGLAPVEPDAGSLIVYAAKHGETALDGDGRNSPFATALMNRIQTPNLEIRRLFDLVRDDVLASTNKQQQPFTYGSLSGSEDFYFVTR
jgi:Caspase domain